MMRLLLAEDERSLSKALVTIFEKNHYSVDAVYDGNDALDYLLHGDYDGAVLDIMMPGLDGISVLKKIRQEGKTVPVLMLTAKSELDDKVLGLDSGANDYLTKPFEIKELLARIRAMTRNSAVQTDSLLQMGNITLNCATFEMSTPKEKLRLANKEYQIMELLLRNPGKLIPTERIMEKVWGYDSEAEINIVWVYISYLRKKLVTLEADVEIKASRNSGYYLEATDD